MSEENIQTPAPVVETIDQIPTKLPVLPLRDVVIYPYMIFPVLVGRESSLKAAAAAMERGKNIFLVAQKNASVDDPGPDDVYKDGTVAKIIQMLKLPNGLMKILVDGLVQASAKEYHPRPEYLEAEIAINCVELPADKEIEALIRHTTALFTEYVRLNRNIPGEVLMTFEGIKEPQRKMFYMAANISQSVDVKQHILQIQHLRDQFFELSKILTTEVEILKIERDIDTKVQDNIQKSQRKFFIQEQIRILQDELGEDEASPELAKLRDQIRRAKMPKEISEKALEEFNKLKKTPPMSPEFTVTRNYLDWLISVPWFKRTKDDLNVEHVRKILDNDHYSLEKPKERIVEHIAVLNLVREMKGQILCFVGPPGVGKTSLAKSIARALGRKFVRISLGGVRDEAEIRGHRRTYIGSMPGKIIQSMKRAGTVNPVILMDEVDKMSMDFRGDPSAALLEVLDPEQNVAFSDHYLEVDYDLSKVMFITTANVRYNIPLPLQDRMESIELPGYLEHEKKEIAKRHIVPRQLEEHGLKPSRVSFKDEAILRIIREYTREAGVRNLEREIASVCRKVAKTIVLGDSKNGHAKSRSRSKGKAVVITPEAVEQHLGVPKFRVKEAERKPRIGSVTGLAWTSVGGDILNVDVTIMRGAEKLTLTGQLGDVMKESAQAALSYIRSNPKLFGVNPEFTKGREIHVHLPEGSIPKDGPSAGITLAMAIISAASGKPARNDVAMTGEITLRGNVLPIGGLNEKLLAAQRSGITTVLIPKENVKDLEEIPARVKEGLKIIAVETIQEAFKHVFKGRRSS
ncbi:MAG: endopeptidase La [Ignavibacteria bacterium GWA2_55_11]|nr:MAG: endopeptidase La [Ignavibacteria bacterium GWA2_55_11]OGU64098.1 MAG: endopeptidase La [Ignavibacteria bacterium RIFCSPHIGHO2_02_FULL_56_12]OGU75086.1 MAG: endopeptidase La [Ignavibacteria bacterium RIFCSPLOWO2_02_FULL_55_14]